MIKSLKKLAIQAGLEYFGKDISIETLAINSNEIRQNCLFIAIIANRNGHDFIENAIDNGAKAILVSIKQKNSFPQIVCKNTIKGLQALAKEYRKTLTMPIISITGSCGKTSVKEMIVTLLESKKVHYTKGNLNNYIGVPITILETPYNVDFLIIEVGTSTKGEIKTSADIVRPTVSIITNIGACHLQNFKSIDGVINEKIELVKVLTKNNFFILNLDDKKILSYTKKIKCKKITCSINNPKANISLLKYRKELEISILNIRIFDEKYTYKLSNVSGKHNVFNSILAIASLISLGFEPKKILINTNKIKNYKARFSTYLITDKLTLIDDTYNASAISVEAAIKELSEFNGKKILVITSMCELGKKAERYHIKMGKWLKRANLNNIFLFGEKKYINYVLKEGCLNNNTKYFDCKKKLNNELSKLLNDYKSYNTKLMVKGSRNYKMEEIISFVKKLTII